MYVSSGEAQEFYKVSEETLRLWANKKRIEYIKTKGGHRRYYIQDNGGKDESRKSYIYARVSSRKQEGDLERQVEFMQKQYPKFEVIRDIGSGANFKRNGLKRLLAEVMQGNVGEIAIYTKDRLTRFGGDLIEFICDTHDTKLLFWDEKEDGTDVEDLGKDLLTIITHFTAKYYGSRKYKEAKSTEV